VVWRASQAVRCAGEEVRNEHEFRFTSQAFIPSPNLGFETMSSPQVFLQAATFQDHFYIVGPTALREFSSEGLILHQYSVGNELPGSPLTALGFAILADSSRPELILATADAGLLAFSGRGFRQILPLTPEARSITSILPSKSCHRI
jgi:hypothetical protein